MAFREVDEEMELETRCGQPQPEVLYEADAHIDRDDDDDHVHDNVCNDDGNGNRTNDDDGWSNDNWGDDDEDEESAPSLQGSRPRTDTLKAAESTGASAAGTPLNPDKGDKDR
ncbi:hypothetical protein FBU59_005455 [Linderina macrospora]|uniref:Uncharacterized protein n=1 Tax=Linderina macrospora TaxID=4868 RepID=A0ACC1J2M1_9FUNG|nr:hypothetical protein FBU59_005455 [Linderina macrospora]